MTAHNIAFDCTTMIPHGVGLLYALLLATNHDSSTRSNPFDWLIVGGGLHGVALGARLAAKGITNFAIVDDSAQLLNQWKRRSKATGMKYMRSSATFHLDVDKDALHKFAAKKMDHKHLAVSNKKKTKKRQTKIKRNNDLFASDYERPSLELFNEHCDHVMEKYQLHKHHIPSRVEHIALGDDLVTVTVKSRSDVQHQDQPSSSHTTLQARKVVLALGSDDPTIPSWARQANQTFLPHILDTQEDEDLSESKATTSLQSSSYPSNSWRKAAIVGGGITAVHKALEFVQQYRKAAPSTSLEDPTDSPVLVHIISRHELIEQQFDTHQDWMMDDDAVQRSVNAGGSGLPQRLADFRALESCAERRRIIQHERRAGTVPASLSRKGLQDAMKDGLVQWHVGEIDNVRKLDNQQTLIELSHDHRRITADQVLLATGFGKGPPGWDTLLAPLVESFDLPISPVCGYPIVDAGNLQWSHPRLYVTGALADLALGPSSRNLAGARMAAERIVKEG